MASNPMVNTALGGHPATVARTGAATPFSVFGITSAFWAILAGIAASFMAERGALLAYWRGGTAAKD